MKAACENVALESIIEKKKKVWRFNKEHSFSITATTVAMVTTKHERHFEIISSLDELIVLELSITTLMCSKVALERHGTGANFPTPKYQKHHSAVWKWHLIRWWRLFFLFFLIKWQHLKIWHFKCIEWIFKGLIGLSSSSVNIQSLTLIQKHYIYYKR